ncbi:MAG: methyl-accepting chemotaxis protein [Sandaracinaceae bacterium]
MDFFEKLTKSGTFYPGAILAILGLIPVAWPDWAGPHVSQLIAWVLAVVGFVVIIIGIRGVKAEPVRTALREMVEGRPPTRPSSSDPELASLFDELHRVSTQMTRTTTERDELQRSVDRLEDELDAARRPAVDPSELERVARDREELRARITGLDADLQRATEDLRTAQQRLTHGRVSIRDAEGVIAEHVDKLSAGFGEQMAAVEQTIDSMQGISAALHQIAQHVEALASNAEESSSSILEMTATNDEVAENMANLANSVRETVSSIEEMTYSIKEVARNVDALSLTAEETSSSMNEMDVSIDQVQSNANETARLSEEVAADAEKGAEAILKTIDEINRIKETSSEAVEVISNLGSRIEAIGDILNVIDDVAEQTNLLALNAAIIAAQAGEHGKGFAVVADEIKDLAERAGASTKEIAELIKTIQNESKKGIVAVQLGAATVDRGVEVSAEAERALKKILSSSQKSTSMVRAIARATVEQAKGSKQVTDAIGRIAETVQQIAAATAEQARGSELIMKSAEKMRLITQHVERSSQEQARGGRQISQAIENISGMVNELHQSQRAQARGSEQTLAAVRRIHELTRAYEAHVRELSRAAERLRGATVE